MKPEDLITYCGGFCGTCARCSQYTAFREAASVLAELTEGHGFHHWMPGAVKEFDYTEFRKGLIFFADPDSWLVCRNACKGGNGGPPFCVRNCCEQHKVDICFECEEFPCEKTKPFEGIVERAQEYRTLGRSEWLRRQVEKAHQGFEGHTRKYYRVSTSDTPPES